MLTGWRALPTVAWLRPGRPWQRSREHRREAGSNGEAVHPHGIEARDLLVREARPELVDERTLGIELDGVAERVDRIGDCNQGLARFVVVPITKVFHYQGPNVEPEFDVIALIHELGHVFGAEHVNDRDSLMHEEFGYRTEFDAKNRAIVQRNRDCPFAK